MEFSFSSGNYYDTEDSFSEDSLNPTFSEDTISCENTTFREEITFNVDFSVQLLLTSECRGGMGNERTALSREGQIQDNPEPAFVQSSAPPSDDHDNMLAGEDYIVQSLLNSLHNYLQNLNGEGNQTGDNENQTGGNENKRDDDENEKNEQIPENDKVDESVFPEPSDGRDFQLGSSSLPHTAQISHREHDTCQDWPKYKPLENKDVQFLEITPMLKGQNLKVVKQTMGNKMVSSTETCWTPSVELEEKDTSSSTHTTCCVNLRHIFHCMRKQVCCCIRRRNSKQTTQSPCQWASESGCPVRGKRIQQEESFE